MMFNQTSGRKGFSIPEPPEPKEPFEHIQLTASTIEVRILGPCIDVTYNVTFQNTHASAPVEARFELPVSSTIFAIYDLSAVFSNDPDHPVKATVVENTIARNRYDDAIAGGKGATLVEARNATSPLTIVFGNIAPQTSVAVTLKALQDTYSKTTVFQQQNAIRIPLGEFAALPRVPIKLSIQCCMPDVLQGILVNSTLIPKRGGDGGDDDDDKPHNLVHHMEITNTCSNNEIVIEPCVEGIAEPGVHLRIFTEVEEKEEEVEEGVTLTAVRYVAQDGPTSQHKHWCPQNHPMEVRTQTESNNAKLVCNFCGKNPIRSKEFLHCSTCDVNACGEEAHCPHGHIMKVLTDRPDTYRGGVACDACNRTIDAVAGKKKETFYHCEGCRNYDVCMECGCNKESLTEYIFLADCSGSMSGDKCTNLRKALQIFLRSLPAHNTVFNIICFGSTVQTMWPVSKVYNASSLEEASAYVVKINSDLGGTRMLAPLQMAMAGGSSSGAVKGKKIFLLTDGLAEDAAEVSAFVSSSDTSKACPLQLFTVGIGSDCSKLFLSNLASARNGVYDACDGTEEGLRVILRQLHIASKRCLSRVCVNGVEVANMLPSESTITELLPSSKETRVTVNSEPVDIASCVVVPIPLSWKGIVKRLQTFRKLKSWMSTQVDRKLRMQDAKELSVKSGILCVPLTALFLESMNSSTTCYPMIEQRSQGNRYIHDDDDDGKQRARQLSRNIDSIQRDALASISRTQALICQSEEIAAETMQALSRQTEQISRPCRELGMASHHNKSLWGRFKDAVGWGKPKAQPFKPQAQPTPPPCLPITPTALPPQDRLHRILLQQTFSGYWSYGHELVTTLLGCKTGTQEASLRALFAPNVVDLNVITTLLVLWVLTKKFTSERSAWQLQLEKAYVWLKDVHKITKLDIAGYDAICAGILQDS